MTTAGARFQGRLLHTRQGQRPGCDTRRALRLFRDKEQFQNFLYDLGEAVAVDVKDNSATLQITVSRDAIYAGTMSR